MKKVLMIAAVALLAVACNKNQRAVKKLDGTWNATSYTVTEDGVSVDWIGTGVITSATFVFDGCKLKDDEFCNITTTVVTAFGTGTEADLYNVTNDGETLQMKDDASSTTINSMEIVELKGSDCTLRQVEDEGTEDETTTMIVLAKQ